MKYMPADSIFDTIYTPVRYASREPLRAVRTQNLIQLKELVGARNVVPHMHEQKSEADPTTAMYLAVHVNNLEMVKILAEDLKSSTWRRAGMCFVCQFRVTPSSFP